MVEEAEEMEIQVDLEELVTITLEHQEILKEQLTKAETLVKDQV